MTYNVFGGTLNPTLQLLLLLLLPPNLYLYGFQLSYLVTSFWSNTLFDKTVEQYSVTIFWYMAVKYGNIDRECVYYEY